MFSQEAVPVPSEIYPMYLNFSFHINHNCSYFSMYTIQNFNSHHPSSSSQFIIDKIRSIYTSCMTYQNYLSLLIYTPIRCPCQVTHYFIYFFIFYKVSNLNGSVYRLPKIKFFREIKTFDIPVQKNFQLYFVFIFCSPLGKVSLLQMLITIS